MKSNAKINLSLEVTSKRRDGYHNIETIFAPISLYDEIEISPTTGTDIEIITDSDIPKDKTNIVYRVLDFLRKKHSITDGFRVVIDKNIPTEAGLGGGSSNGATAAIWFAKNYGVELVSDELGLIGADIPYFTIGGYCIGKGKGEKLKQINSELKIDAILVKSEKGMSTAKAFSNVELTKNKHAKKCAKALATGDQETLIANTFNSFETLFQTEKTMLKGYGFDKVLLCGSGSAFICFGSCDDAKYELLKENYHFVEKVVIG